MIETGNLIDINSDVDNFCKEFALEYKLRSVKSQKEGEGVKHAMVKTPEGQ